MIDLNSYISGYVDGEGCFCVSFQPSKKHLIGWEVRPSFSVSQNFDRAELLYQIKKIWKCGTIRPDRSDKTLKYEVRSIKEIIFTVIPHFENYPILSSKKNDFKLFKEICLMIKNNDHKTISELKKIVYLANQMNLSGKRKYSANEILNSLDSGEGIVYATRNCELT